MIFKKRTKPRQLKALAELEELMDDDKPILLDFWQANCRSCKIMDGIVNELAEEYADSAHVVKVDVGRVPGAVQTFKIRGTPTFVVMGRSQKTSKRKRKQQAESAQAKAKMTPRWRTSGLVNKDVMRRVLESNGASPTAD